MNCEEARLFVDGYVDGELDLVQSMESERHFDSCSGCRALLEQRQMLSRAVRIHTPYFETPPGLADRIRSRIGQPVKKAPERTGPTSWLGWRFAAIAASLLVLVAAAAISVEFLKRPSATEMVAHEVVASHIRSLMANHLADVVSSDQHTVKPWFAGKLDFAPMVKDLASDGFPLTGGRLDYLDGRPVAALVFRRHRHVINLFIWPASSSDSGLKSLSLKGYNVIHWTKSNTAYWAVSDLNSSELAEFARDQQR